MAAARLGWTRKANGGTHHMKPITTWILLADAHSAHVVLHEGPGKPLSKVDTMDWTAKALPDHADQPGRSFSSMGPGSSAMTKGDRGAQAEMAFARTIAADLDRTLRKQAIDRVVLIAAPHMLGALRDALDPGVMAKVTHQIDKDLMKVPLHDLARHLDGIVVI